jgi:radical SAM protein with 4Fe4S-binding SPASM domain
MHKLFDAQRFLSLLTIRKIINLWVQTLLNHCSYLSRKSLHGGYPWSISIETSSVCNLKCPECPTGRGEVYREYPEMPFEIFKKIIDESATHLIYLMLYFQGEPFLAKNFHRMVSYAKNKKIYTMTSTNGHFLGEANCEKIIESGLDRIIISVDGATAESYKKYRVNGDFNKVTMGIKNLVAAKRKRKVNHPLVVLQAVIFKHNQEEIQQVKEFGKKLGVNKITYKSAQIQDFKNGSDLMPVEKHTRYIKKNGFYQLKKRNRMCRKIWASMVFTTGGNALPCCYDKHGKYIIGNIQSEKIHEIWNSPKLQDFRHRIIKNKEVIGICNNCFQ